MYVSLPGVHGNISVNYVVRMLGLLELTVPEDVVAGDIKRGGTDLLGR